MVTSHVMDFEQVLEQSPGAQPARGRRRRPARCGCRRAALVGAARRQHAADRVPGEERAIADAFADALGAGWGGVALVVTNPVDPLVTRLQQRTGIDRRRILGYTLNDSLRLRTGIAKALGARAGERRRMGRRRARRAERAALRPRRGRTARRSSSTAEPDRGRGGLPARLVPTARRARLGAVVDLDVGARRRAHDRGARAATASSGRRRSSSRASTGSMASQSPCP